MIIRLNEQEGISDLVEKLKLVPKEKRKVIILVGRHRNEGTHLLARKHHGEWEEHGAVVVQIPSKWTPNVFWRRIKKDKKGEKYDVTPYLKKVPTDKQIVNALTTHLNVPIVNFHTTPTYSATPDPTFGHMLYFIEKNSKLPPHQNFLTRTELPYADQIQALHPAELLVEYKYDGKLRGKTQYTSTIVTALSAQNMPNPHELHNTYLTNPAITPSAVKNFTKRFNRQFCQILQHLT